jgi:hypothetical protein
MGVAAMIDGGTFSVLRLTQTRALHNLTAISLNGVTLGVARAELADAIGGTALLWRDLTASRSLDSITLLAALQKTVKNKLLSTAENWGIDALTSIICFLSLPFGSNNFRSNKILSISVSRSCLCCHVPCICRSMAVQCPRHTTTLPAAVELPSGPWGKRSEHRAVSSPAVPRLQVSLLSSCGALLQTSYPQHRTMYRTST